MIYRRQRQQVIFAGFLAIIAVVNVLFFFILNRPTRVEYDRLEDSVKQLRSQVAADRLRLASVEKISQQLDRFDKDKFTFISGHLIPRTTGYSQIVLTLNSMAQKSGVRKTRVIYNLDPKPHAGLNTVEIVLPLEGSYTSIVSFIRELEKSEIAFVITGINLETSALPSGAQAINVSNSNSATPGSTVGLALALETYFYQ